LDIERKRYPDIRHTAVIVAEEITSRFFNVISLFNQSIPIIALKLTALKLGDQYGVIFTKILITSGRVSKRMRITKRRLVRSG